MSTLSVVEDILRETGVPMSVKEIVERSGIRLPSKSKTPDTVVARDLSMDLKRKGDDSAFIRTSPGRYTLRDLWRRQVTVPSAPEVPTSVLASAMRQDRAAPMPIRKDDKSSASEASRSSG